MNEAAGGGRGLRQSGDAGGWEDTPALVPRGEKAVH